MDGVNLNLNPSQARMNQPRLREEQPIPRRRSAPLGNLLSRPCARREEVGDLGCYGRVGKEAEGGRRLPDRAAAADRRRRRRRRGEARLRFLRAEGLSSQRNAKKPIDTLHKTPPILCIYEALLPVL